MNYTLFKACRQFYKVYPQIGSTVSHEFKLPDFDKIFDKREIAGSVKL